MEAFKKWQKIEIRVIAAYMWVIFFDACNAAGQGPFPKFPAILVFGDSIVDTGNNNFINTLVRGNFFPYRQNYPGQKATGRFSDGKLIPDLLSCALKIKEAVPPFLDPNCLMKNSSPDLYVLGCRSITVDGLLPIGYAPIEKTIHTTNKGAVPSDKKWVVDVNSYAQSYNLKLFKLLAHAQATGNVFRDQNRL
ncbi:unnamed protein product [Dovyalis caffra]|uniref:GDSL esterase/lipase n=1 Tax=Dovyalis caffra TaxID=77055 RepID=A0AAV1R122_9ROSI|nr:unnamed protein product [Dovyalis caffra]